MFSSHWQVGLDIQHNGFWAVAVKQRRYGYQLCHWYHYIEKADLEKTNLGENPHSYSTWPELFSGALHTWRCRLPKHIDLRISIPVDLIFQHYMPLPEQQLSELELSWLIEGTLSKHLSLPVNELMFDYRYDRAQTTNKQLMITAIKSVDMKRWLTFLNQVDLSPTVIDIAPSVLRSIATRCQFSTDVWLFHHCANGWLLVAPSHHQEPYYFVMEEVITHALLMNTLGVVPQPTKIVCSGLKIEQTQTLIGARPWSAFSAIQQMTPPLPVAASEYVLACGLALRDKDSLCWR